MTDASKKLTIISKKMKYAVIVDGLPSYLIQKPHKIKDGYLSKDGRPFRGKDVRLVQLNAHNRAILGVSYG